jgi:hypothetical protein
MTRSDVTPTEYDRIAREYRVDPTRLKDWFEHGAFQQKFDTVEAAAVALKRSDTAIREAAKASAEAWSRQGKQLEHEFGIPIQVIRTERDDGGWPTDRMAAEHLVEQTKAKAARPVDSSQPRSERAGVPFMKRFLQFLTIWGMVIFVLDIVLPVLMGHAVSALAYKGMGGLLALIGLLIHAGPWYTPEQRRTLTGFLVVVVVATVALWLTEGAL